MSKRKIVIPSNPQHDTPLRLDIAATIAFPDGTMGAAGLRRERDRGRLITEFIAGKEYVTLAEIKRMRELCRIQKKPISTSETAAVMTAQEVLRIKLEKMAGRKM